jgi:hypothetical protein
VVLNACKRHVKRYSKILLYPNKAGHFTGALQVEIFQPKLAGTKQHRSATPIVAKANNYLKSAGLTGQLICFSPLALR